MRTRLLRLILVSVLIAVATFVVSAQQPPSVTNVLLVTMDGMRWQEVFGGLQAPLVSKTDGGVADADVAWMKEHFDAATPEALATRLREVRRALGHERGARGRCAQDVGGTPKQAGPPARRSRRELLGDAKPGAAGARVAHRLAGSRHQRPT